MPIDRCADGNDRKPMPFYIRCKDCHAKLKPIKHTGPINGSFVVTDAMIAAATPYCGNRLSARMALDAAAKV